MLPQQQSVTFVHVAAKRSVLHLKCDVKMGQERWRRIEVYESYLAVHFDGIVGAQVSVSVSSGKCRSPNSLDEILGKGIDAFPSHSQIADTGASFIFYRIDKSRRRVGANQANIKTGYTHQRVEKIVQDEVSVSDD
ncbi:MAG: hypothetical protein F2840_09105 [Actinobacteria bacterium]|jgi:hypothetical protein|uniref:Unannotated protein n=1 Tax=freshwater metagenome TaxID=449393 RepID=A0A6J7KH98_9ZZZZ|nr:hypothetical protein [Actinomycetota bacterium]